MSAPPETPDARGGEGAEIGEGEEEETEKGFYELEEQPELAAVQGDAAREEEEEEDAEDLVGDGMERDYVAEPELDHYDPEMLDHRSYAPPSAGQRAAAEAELRDRDRSRLLEGRAGGQTALDRARWLQRVPAVLLADEAESTAVAMRPSGNRTVTDEPEDEAAVQQPAPAKRRRMLYDEEEDVGRDGAEMVAAAEEDEEDVAASAVVEGGIDHTEGNLRELLALDSTRREVAKRFRGFLLAGGSAYKRRISTMCAANQESLPVSFGDLSNAQPTLSTWLTEEPGMMLPIMDEAATRVTLRMFPEYRRILNSRHSSLIHVRITDLPIADTVRDLRQYHLNHLIKVVGVVTRRTSVFPQLVAVKFDCPACRCVIGPFTTSDVTGAQPPQIAACPNCHSRGPFHLNTEQTLFRNYQKITLQESPGTVPPGRLPRSKEVILLCDLIDSCRPGEEIEVIGIYRHSYDMALNHSHGFPVFSTIIEANNVVRHDDVLSSFKLTEEDEQRIRRLATEENILERITASIAPSICGHANVKLALAMALFGGETRVLRSKGQHRIRGDINVLLLGDPGVAKSQFLKFVEKTSHRAVFTTGKGSTAVGLTAAVHKDSVTKEWTLEGGALVLADRGICLIDEFDKMNDQDRTSIHEAMEQQSISISKAGIVTTLQARCSVIAAANPIKGRYNSALPFKDNVELTEPILSRFDIILVILDKVDTVQDRNLARFVVQSHIMSHPHHRALRKQLGPAAAAAADVDDANLIPQDLLRKYIMYARTHVSPQWVYNAEFQTLASIYADMRQVAEAHGGFPICMRHVESAMRMAEACARLHLRDHVRDSDMHLAVRVMLESFIGTHKESVAKTLTVHFRPYLTYGKDDNYLLSHLLLELVRQRCWLRQRGDEEDDADDEGTPAVAGDTIAIDREDFETIAGGMKIADCRAFYASMLFTKNGFSLVGSKIVKKL